MGRTPMPSERREKIKEIAAQTNFKEAAKILGLSSRTVSRIVHGREAPRKHREIRQSDLQKAEARRTAVGCLNVHEVWNWLTG